MITCKKCWMWKTDEKWKCACTKKVKKKDKWIKKISNKKKKEIKKRWSLIKFYQKISQNYFDENWNWKCEYCWKEFNIWQVLDQRTCFAHILAKWDVKYKHLSVFPNNIAIVCWEKCHKDMDMEISILWIKKELQGKIENWEKIKVNNLEKYLK